MDLNREYSNNIEVPFYKTVAEVLLELYIFIGIICLIVGIFITIYGNIEKTSKNKSDDKIESSVGIIIIILSIFLKRLVVDTLCGLQFPYRQY